MGKESLQRGFFGALAVVLAAAALYMVVGTIVGDITGGRAHHHHGLVLVVANIIEFAVVPVVAWLALLSWRRAQSN
jgi:hypothetical protein